MIPNNATSGFVGDNDRRAGMTTLENWLRERIRKRMLFHFQPGDHLLEIGTRTSTESIWLAQQGINVTVTVDSAEALNANRELARENGLSERLSFQCIDLNGRLPAGFGRKFDGLYADFGVLNHVANRRVLAGAMSGWLRYDAPALLLVTNPICPWEMARQLLRGRPKKAVRRGATLFEQSDESLPSYPTPRTVETDFKPNFTRTHIEGMGVWLPPLGNSDTVDRHPGIFRALHKLESKAARFFPCTWLNDHYLLELCFQGPPERLRKSPVFSPAWSTTLLVRNGLEITQRRTICEEYYAESQV